MKNLLKKNYKLILGIILGVILTSGVVFAASISSNNVTFDNSQSGISATTVQGAIDDLYTKANTWIDSNNMGTPINYIFDGENKPTTSSATTPPSGKNVYLGLYADGQYGVCIKRNGTQHCFRYNNWVAEAKHVQEVFSDVGAYDSSTGLGCYVYSYYVMCNASDFNCFVGSDGDVHCDDFSDSSNCIVFPDGSVDCG